MSDDALKKMIADAERERANRDANDAARKSEEHAATVASGRALRGRVMPRLLAAKEAWSGKLDLKISDQTDKLMVGSTRLSPPAIAISAHGKQFAAYTFVSHSPGYVSVREGDRGASTNSQIAYEFKFERIEDLTEGDVDLVLDALLKKAYVLGKA